MTTDNFNKAANIEAWNRYPDSDGEGQGLRIGFKVGAEWGRDQALTPDAITDEMVERGAVASWRGDVARPDWTFEDISDEDQDWYRDNARAVLTAALIEPPARPEGAKDIEVLLFDVGVDENRAEVADYLAARLTVSPKENR